MSIKVFFFLFPLSTTITDPGMEEIISTYMLKSKNSTLILQTQDKPIKTYNKVNINIT